MADLHVPIRAGSDIAFLGGLVRYVLENERWFHDYVVHYTNASAIIDERFADTEDLDGLFSGYDHEKRPLRHRVAGSTRASTAWSRRPGTRRSSPSRAPAARSRGR